MAAASTPNRAVATPDGYAHWVILDGLFSGTWRCTDTPAGVQIRVTPHVTLTAAHKAAITAAGRRYSTFLAQPVTVLSPEKAG